MHELLDADRELTEHERRRLRTLAATGWAHITGALRNRAHQTYSLAEAADFAECIFNHMSVDDRASMILADVYNCPGCSRLLKDRRTPVASGILVERERMRQLWLQVEQAPEGERQAAIDRFRSALGL